MGVDRQIVRLGWGRGLASCCCCSLWAAAQAGVRGRGCPARPCTSAAAAVVPRAAWCVHVPPDTCARQGLVRAARLLHLSSRSTPPSPPTHTHTNPNAYPHPNPPPKPQTSCAPAGQVKAARADAFARRSTPSWFVLFKSQAAAAVASQCVMHAEDSRKFQVRPAVPPWHPRPPLCPLSLAGAGLWLGRTHWCVMRCYMLSCPAPTPAPTDRAHGPRSSAVCAALAVARPLGAAGGAELWCAALGSGLWRKGSGMCICGAACLVFKP